MIPKIYKRQYLFNILGHEVYKKYSQLEGQNPASDCYSLRSVDNVDIIQMKIPRTCHINRNNNQIIQKIFLNK